VRLVLVLDCADPNQLAGFWAQALRCRANGAGDPYVVLVPEAPDQPELLLQHVPERKVGKKRMHFDMRLDDLESEVERLTALGATELSSEPIRRGRIPEVMADPEGNEFCVCVEPPGARASG
jgi:hypothetical protein